MYGFCYFIAMSGEQESYTDESALAEHLIELYRNKVSERYTYQNLDQKIKLPASITPEVVEEMRHYFLNYVYPPAAEREQLEAAFGHLQEYVQKPSKVWFLLGDMASAVVRFGLQLPKALKAGVLTLESYLNAREFEQMLLKQAKEEYLEPPLNDVQFETLMGTLPRHKVEHFINEVGNMFSLLSDTRLSKKTIQIIEKVIDKMLKHPGVYTAEEVEGIQLGLQILKEGNKLFEKYSHSTKRDIVAAVKEAEHQYLDYLYAE